MRLLPDLAQPVVHANDRGAGRKHVGLAAAVGAEDAFSNLHLQTGFLKLLLQQCALRLRIVAVHPCQCSVTLHIGQCHPPLGLEPLGLAFELFSPQQPFRSTGDLLGNADAPHGKRIA